MKLSFVTQTSMLGYSDSNIVEDWELVCLHILKFKQPHIPTYFSELKTKET